MPAGHSVVRLVHTEEKPVFYGEQLELRPGDLFVDQVVECCEDEGRQQTHHNQVTHLNQRIRGFFTNFTQLLLRQYFSRQRITKKFGLWPFLYIQF